MSRETSKASKLPTRQELYRKYLSGIGIDIGGGDDTLKGDCMHALRFDKSDGDAQVIQSWNWENLLIAHCGCVEGESLADFAYSSHCIEHMEDVPLAIKNWATLIREGGTMFLCAPDYLLYERLQWPSRYNSDHKAAFSLFAISPDRRPEKFYGYAEMVEIGKAAGLELVHAETEAIGYDFSLLQHAWLDQTSHFNACANAIFVYRKL